MKIKKLLLNGWLFLIIGICLLSMQTISLSLAWLPQSVANYSYCYKLLQGFEEIKKEALVLYQVKGSDKKEHTRLKITPNQGDGLFLHLITKHYLTWYN